MPKPASFLTAAAALALIVLVGLPVLFILLQAIFPEFARGSFAGPFSKLALITENERLLTQARNTLMLAFVVIIGCLIFGLPIGILRGLYDVPGARIWDVIFLVPFLIPPFIAAIAWMMTLQPRGYLEQLTGIDLGGFLFSFVGVAFVMTLNLFPLVYFAVSRAFEAVGGRFAAAARVHGAGPWRAFFIITLPLSIPAIAASLLIVFAMSIEEFGTPAALAARTGFEVLVTGIYTRLSDWPIDLSGAALGSVMLMALVLAAFILQNWIATRRSYISQGGKPADIEKARLGTWRWPVLGLFWLVALIGVVIPLAAISVTSLLGTISGGLSWSNLDLRHYTPLVAPGSRAAQALMTSGWLALLTALATAAIGGIVAYIVVRGTGRGRAVMDGLSVLPNAIPAIVLAVGVILAWNSPFLPITLYGTAAILLVAYIGILLPYPIRYAVARLRQISGSLDDAARVAGASRGRAMRHITLPLMAPSLIAAMMLVFAIASRELVASIMLAPAGMRTVGTFVFAQFEQGSVQTGMAMSVIAITITSGILLAVNLWLARRGGNAFTG
ncbi:MAG: iron(III) transport system permease protein [Saliniramus fredricksonii]|uniref:Iron(III) transport system permease protein n=1 Tax=Saliniramus fredricksonii TaxID=1653334 RepID=A0A0P7Y4S8_9HYPH|nr:iron ABC transporter permease [Saliniramus fredricksonii]KPQ11750.1 MAG: iron(III) transport system permease protein [Saliniramus fredricksonii]SCC82325.1 iron(III) transport system permease protein [Saliniramus fredricksonii]